MVTLCALTRRSRCTCCEVRQPSWKCCWSAHVVLWCLHTSCWHRSFQAQPIMLSSSSVAREARWSV